MSDLLHCICHRTQGPPAGGASLRAAPPHRALSVSTWNGWAEKEESGRFPDRTASTVSFPGRWR
jgi:hypothetical protein